MPQRRRTLHRTVHRTLLTVTISPLLTTVHMLDILLEEPHFIVINKPSGLFSQSAPGIENVQSMLIEQLAKRDNHPGQPFIGLPHRLDRGTSGVMLLARNQRALKRFGGTIS